MTEIEKALGHFVDRDELDKDEFDNDVWKKEVGPALVLLEKYGLTRNYYSHEEDYPLAGDLTLAGVEAKSKL